jgi:hypothetical protein
MGLRRLRARLDQVQGNANLTMADIQALVDDLSDGFGVTAILDADKTKAIFTGLMTGMLQGKIELPISFVIDPTIDTKGK